jgi:peroxiredoxin
MGVYHQEEVMRLHYLLLLLLVIFIHACATPGPQIESLPALSFNAPINVEGRKYLGLPADAMVFSLDDIDARVVLVEVFQVQCFHCQDEAQNVNELFEQINQEGLYRRVKVMAIAYGNSSFETSLYARKYHVPFALIADPRQQTIAVEATPAYFLLQPMRGGARVLYSKYGSLPKTSKCIELIKERAGLK